MEHSEILKIMDEKFAELSKNFERTIILIDHSNLNQTWRRVESSPSNRPDYVKLKSLLLAGRMLKQVRLYYSDVSENTLQEVDKADWQRRQEFYNFLRHDGWFLRGVRKKIHGVQRLKRVWMEC